MNVEDIEQGQSFTVLKKVELSEAWKMPQSRKQWEDAPDWVRGLEANGLIDINLTQDNEKILNIIARKAKGALFSWTFEPGDFLIEGEMLPVKAEEIKRYYDFM